MPRGRPCKHRQINCNPDIKRFKPAGIRGEELELVELGLDELEAMRLVDFEGLYQQEAADKMGVSRTTLGRLLEIARKKTADMLLHGKMIVINQSTASKTEPIDNNQK